MFATRSRCLLNVSRRTVTPQARLYATDTAGRLTVTLKNTKYTATARAAGSGRNGEVHSADETPLTLTLARPAALGGPGGGTNPEQLFAMGYASCFLGALQLMAGRLGKSDAVKDAVIHTSVHLGEAEIGGFGIAVDIKVEGVEDEEVIKAGHEACPYSRALVHGIKVNISKA
ncbi:OsmC-like protein [Boletus edulis BED1]|uniref:OsmC-like protein n=1 Tax=Boletus edulis BED1 TaxID=1328754 RepID=A0AAD4C016_BOLED|nr:OsmC-like protein [Boletus edulis BED1]